MAGPWEKYQTAPAAPAMGAMPQPMVIGTPRVKTPDPLALAANARAEEASNRADAADARAAASAAREEQRFAERNAPKPVSDPKLVESERTAAFLTTRLLGSFNDIDAATKADPDASKPSIGAGIAGVFGAEARNWANTPARRQVEAAQMDMLDAALTLGTGAAYTREQLEGYRESYFPKLTDDPAQIASKRRRLMRVIEAAKVKAGGAAPKIDEALARLRGVPGAGTANPDGDTGSGAEPVKDRFGNFTTPTDPDALVVDIEGGREPTPAERVALENEFGKPIDNGDGAFGAAARGFGDTVTFGTLDELGGFTDTAGQLLAGDMKGSFGEAMSRNINRNRAILKGDEQRNPGARIAGQFAGALIPFGGALSGAVTAGRTARVGAAQGAAYGFGSGEGGPLDRVPNALMGAGAGAAGGYAIGRAIQAAPRVGSAIARRVAGPSTPEQQALVAAADRQNVPLNMSDVRPGAGNVFASLESMPGSTGPIQRSVAAGRDAIEARVGELGAGGTARETNAAGETVQGAGMRFIVRSRQVANRLYDRAQTRAGNTTVQPATAIAEIDQNIATLQATPETNRELIGYLTDVRSDLAAPGGLGVDAIRRMRTAMRGTIATRNLTATDAQRIVGNVLTAAGQDLEAALPANAAGAFRTADAFYRQKQTYIQDVVQKFTGPRNPNAPDVSSMSGEQALAKLRSMAAPGGDSRRMNEMWRALDPDEANDIAATFAADLGRRGVDEPFSPATFVSNAIKLSPAARRTAFGVDGAAAIDDLTALSRAKTATIGRLNNSRSGVVSNYRAMVFGALGIGGGATGVAGPTGGAAAVALMGAGVAGSRALASVMTNPRFTRIIATAPGTANPAAINAHFGRLRRLAVQDPNVRGVVQALEQRLLSSVSQQPRVAADEPNEAGQPVQ